MFKFGVDSLIWTEEFTEKDLPLIEKAKKLGFKVMDINISHPERFPVKAVARIGLKKSVLRWLLQSACPRIQIR